MGCVDDAMTRPGPSASTELNKEEKGTWVERRKDTSNSCSTVVLSGSSFGQWASAPWGFDCELDRMPLPRSRGS